MVSMDIKSFLKSYLNNPCGNSVRLVTYITSVIFCLIIWTLLFLLLGSDVEPGGPLFTLFVLAFFCYLGGWLVSLVHLPPLIGMLLCGLVMQNTGFYHITENYLKIVTLIREVALVTILLKAGLGLKPSNLKKLSFTIAKLSVVPCISEIVAVAVTAQMFMYMPWLWGLLLGSVLSALSPAVVVPSLLAFKTEGYGENKGIATLVVASSSIDDIISISAFGILLQMVFTDNIQESLIRGPIEAAIGIGIGFGWGFIAACFPNQKEEYLVLKRTWIVGGGALATVLITSQYGFEASGPLAVIILSFVAQFCWRWQGWMVEDNPVGDIISSLWFFIQPLLFGLIGTEINLSTIEPSLILSSFKVILFGLLVRLLSCSIALIGANLNWKEKFFINLAWLPKATVQATLGPIALNRALSNNDEEIIRFARTILTVAVLAILITAPIGAISIEIGGKRLLNKPNKTIQVEPAEIEEAQVWL